MLGAAALGAIRPGGQARAESATPADDGRRLLFVVSALGGASIIDSFLPVASDEVPAGVDPLTLNTYDPELIARPPGSEIRCVRPLGDTGILQAGYSLEQFLAAHFSEMTVVAHESTSVNHAVAQRRALTGAGIDRGRTIAEAVAEVHGAGLPLANCTMAFDGFAGAGDDPELAIHAQAEFIGDPMIYAMSTHGSRGLPRALPTRDIARAREVRARLEEVSPFGRTYADAPAREQYRERRRTVGPALEKADAIDNLMLMSIGATEAELGLQPSPLRDSLLEVFPRLEHDPWQQRGALAFLLSYYGLSCASTISLSSNPTFGDGGLIGAPLAFDFSHTTHRATQSVMWGRVLELVDGLIRLLRRFDYRGDPSLGTMWDRSLIYIATEFGRDKRRASGSSFGTGHHLNNGSVLLSPRLRGNRVFGGVDPATLLTHGFDGRTGEARPDRVMREGDVYSIIAHAMDVDFPGRRDMSGLMAT